MRLRKLVLLVLVLGCVPAVTAQAQTPPPAPLPSAGGLAELSDPATCAIAPGAVDEEGNALGGCQTLAPLLGAQAVTASPDGRFVYVAGGSDAFTVFGHGGGYGGLTVLSRDPASGALARIQCLSSDGTDGATSGGCDPLTAAVDIVGLTMSPDGTAVVAAASGSGSITLLSRDVTTGRLTEVACAQESVPYGGRCLGAPSLEGVGSVAFSPDGKDIYAASAYHSAILQLRLAEDGTLVKKCVSADGSSGSCARVPQLVNPGTLQPSPDGRFVYSLTALGITWLTRDATTGALASGGCVVPATGAACGAGRGAETSSWTGDGQRLVMSAAGDTFLSTAGYYESAQLTVLRRSAADGTLQRTGCLAPLPYQDEGDDEEEDDSYDEDAADDDTRAAATRQAPPCAQAPVVPAGGAMTGLSDGRFLLSGYGVLAVVTVGADGVPREDGCMSTDDNRCVVTKRSGAATAAVATPGGGALLVGSGIAQLVAAPQATARAVGGRVQIRVACPAGSAGCGGTATVDPLGANLRAPVTAARTAKHARFSVAAGQHGAFTAALPRGARRAAAALTLRSGARTLRILAPVSGLRGVAAPVAPRNCPTGAVLARSGTVSRIVRRRDGAAIACLAGRRPVRLDRFGATVSGPVRLAGHFAAVVLRASAGPGRVHRAVAVVDLRGGRVRWLAGAAQQPVGSGVAALVLKPSGAVAWSACTATRTGRCVAGRGDELHVADARGARTAVIARHRITTLSLHGSELRFQVAGTARTLPLA
jgi:hypothetical protein